VSKALRKVSKTRNLLGRTNDSVTFPHICLAQPTHRSNEAKKIEKYVRPAPGYYAAVYLGMCGQRLLIFTPGIKTHYHIIIK